MYFGLIRIFVAANVRVNTMIKVEFDGCCWPNPKGRASAGVYIADGDDVLVNKGFYIGRGRGMSSNVAEYVALIEALKFLKVKGYTDEKIIVRGDSKLVIMQMSGRWKIKKGLYKEHALFALDLKQDFSDISFEWVSRDFNTTCDELAEHALRC